jgi:preprotein translocase subunit YajC
MCALGLVLGAGCFAQDPATAGQAPASGQGPGPDGEGRRGGPGMAGMGRGIMGMVTEVAPDHFMVKNAANEIYTIHFSANTRMMRQPAGSPRQPGQDRNRDRSQDAGADARPDRGMGGGGAPPTPIKATDIKVGDAIAAGGETDDKAKSVGAVFVMLLDPERAKAMRELQANFGKTWLMGKVTAINETTVTLHSNVDNADHTFMADENTTFRKHGEPITLGDVQAGDNVRIEGATKDGQFVATSVNVMAFPAARGGPVKAPGDKPPQ